jgi:hypothetical protein
MVGYAAESGSELSYGDAAGTNTMPETATADSPPAATATVSASALASHLDCTRTYIGKLEAEGVIQRQGDGYPLVTRFSHMRSVRMTLLFRARLPEGSVVMVVSIVVSGS